MKRYNNDRVLLYGDLHAPYQHKDALKFLASVKDEFKPDRVIDMGDTLDQYSVSRYPKHPGSDDVVRELKKAKKVVSKVASLFPRLDILASNHCDRLYKKATVAGIPREYLLPYNELIGAPKGWKWHQEMSITFDSTREKLFLVHTLAGPTLSLSKNFGCNVAVGHKHNNFGIQWHTTPSSSHYAIDVGCLVSDEGYPFSYNKGNVFRPTRGCVMILEGEPLLIKM